MSINLLDSIGEWNPQLLRELKGRLKPRNTLLAIGTSLMVQVLLVMTAFDEYSSYDTWSDIFTTLTLLLPFVLMVGGAYMLASDLAQEQKQGTLNFIRLCPQSSQSILMGKILGVPIQLYLGIAAAIPLHIVAALITDISLKIIIGGYLILAISACFFYSAALLYIFVGGRQGWLAAVFAAILHLSLSQLLVHSWLLGFIDREDGISIAFIVLNLLVGTYWFWQGSNRRFRNPNATVLSKRQSYWLVTCVEVLLLGTLGLATATSSFSSGSDRLILLRSILSVNFIFFLVLLAILMPQHQALLDWARYRRNRAATAKTFWQRSLIQDLIWAEKSPAMGAIALNLAIVFGFTALWIVSWPGIGIKAQACLELALQLGAILICAAIAHLMMLMKTQKRALWAAVSVGTVVLLPPAILLTLSFAPAQTPVFWLFSTFAWLAVEHASTAIALQVVLGQGLLLVILNLLLAKQLRKLGESASKPLLAGT
ncbi:MAG: hypothetical protein F6K19_39410 [Cyanothece sp. SIO1E1]|nr:hypothetical protein [Cyanothece sp. SIO1E1]